MRPIFTDGLYIPPHEPNFPSTEDFVKLPLDQQKNLIRKGINFYGDFKLACALCTHLSELEDPEVMYLHGLAQKKACDSDPSSKDFSYEAATHWLNQAYLKKHAAAAYELGCICQVRGEYQKAADYFKFAYENKVISQC